MTTGIVVGVCIYALVALGYGLWELKQLHDLLRRIREERRYYHHK